MGSQDKDSRWMRFRRMAKNVTGKNMKILKYPLGQLQANCYFLIQGSDCLIIDPADDASFIAEELQRRRLKLVGMLATHGHFDHILAVGEMQASLGKRRVPYLHVNQKDQFLIDRMEETADHFLGFKQTILPVDKIINLENIYSIRISNFKFEIIHTPGHTPGSVCFYFPEESVIFTGDTLFKGAIGRYDFSYCSREDFKKSLKKLLKLPKKTTVYPGHEDMTTVENENQSVLQSINRL